MPYGTGHTRVVEYLERTGGKITGSKEQYLRCSYCFMLLYTAGDASFNTLQGTPTRCSLLNVQHVAGRALFKLQPPKRPSGVASSVLDCWNVQEGRLKVTADDGDKSCVP